MRKVKFLIVLCLGIILITGCSSSATVSSSSNEEKETTSVKNYGINEDMYVTTDEGKYRLKITGIKETKERNEYSDKKANRVVIISYEYENISLQDDLYVSEMSFKVYDKEGNALETYPVTYKYADSIGTGRRASAEMAFALNSETNYIELEYYDNMFNSKSDCLIKIEW